MVEPQVWSTAGDADAGARQREHHVEVRHQQQLGLALGEPFPCCWTLAFSADCDDDVGIGAVLAAFDMASAAVRQCSILRDHTLVPLTTW